LFGSGFDLTSKGFELVFISESIQPTMIYPLELISKNDLNTYKPQFQHFFFINNTSELFSLTCEKHLLHSLVLERTEYDLSKIN
jgi:hypothetical protein